MTASESEQNKTRRIQLVITEAEYNMLCRMATQDGGIHPSDYGSKLLSERIQEKGLELDSLGKSIPHLRTFMKDYEDREREYVFDTLKRIASRHIINPSEESMEKLKALCDEEGVTVEEVMDDLRESPAVPVVSNTGDTLAKAMNWIVHFMRGKDRISSVAAFEAARVDGFNKRTIEIAKNRLNIPSKKLAGGIWYWVNEKPMKRANPERKTAELSSELD